MAYGRRKKGGSALTTLAERRRSKAAKEGKLEPMVVKQSLSKLRTGAAPKRKKGGQTLKEMSEEGGKRRRAAKAKRVGGKTYVTQVNKKPVTPKKSTPKRKIPAGARSFRGATPTKTTKSAVPPKFPAKGGRGRPPVHKALINYVKENPLEAAAELASLHPIGRGVKWATTLGKGAHKAYKLRKASSKAKKLREAEQAASKKIEQGYARQRESTREASRKNARRR